MLFFTSNEADFVFLSFPLPHELLTAYWLIIQYNKQKNVLKFIFYFIKDHVKVYS